MLRRLFFISILFYVKSSVINNVVFKSLQKFASIYLSSLRNRNKKRVEFTSFFFY